MALFILLIGRSTIEGPTFMIHPVAA